MEQGSHTTCWGVADVTLARVEHELHGAVLWIRVRGRPDTSAFLALLAQVERDVPAPRPLHVLIDVRQANGGPPTRDLERVSEYFLERQHVFDRKALLVASALQYGLARVGQALNQVRGMDLEIFRDERAALEALGSSKAAE